MTNTTNLFLIDQNERYTYDDLLYKINHSVSYSPLPKTECLFEYFSNLFLALVANKPLVLPDSDLKSGKSDEENDYQLNSPVSLSKPHFPSIDDLIVRLNQSSSDITLFTSGTTGQPKKVIHSVPSLTRSIKVAGNYKNQVWAFAYNPTHMAGLQVLFQAFENKNTLVNLFNATRSDVYKAIEKYQITHISATPTFYRLLLPVEQKCDSVQRVTLGGEKSNQKLHNDILKIFPYAKLNNVYASTEAGSLFAAKGEYFQIPTSLVGKVKIENDELLLHQFLLGTSDYFELTDDYYKTGDLVEWADQEQRLFRFKSRKNELVNVGGYKVNPEEVEDAISQIVGVEQVMVYGKPNSVLGNVLCADVKIEDNAHLSELMIRKSLNGKLQDYKIPRQIKLVESFSLTRTGKTKRL
jgi:acyl-coenzyme A synthetase/AMP-(fatty) acid ligase